MSKQRLIDGGELLYKFSFSEDGRKYSLHDCDNFPEKVNLEDAQKMIRNAPTIPAEIVVYCGECKFYGNGPFGKGCNTFFDGRGVVIPKKPNDYCSCGEQNEKH